MFLYFNRVVADDMIWDTKHHIHTPHVSVWLHEVGEANIKSFI